MSTWHGKKVPLKDAIKYVEVSNDESP